MAAALPRWLDWAREIQSLAQTGSHYSHNIYEKKRYQRLSEIAAEIVSEHTELEEAGLVAAFAGQIGYATPRVDVRGAVFKDNKLLMVRERLDGCWSMPGGWADVGDVPSEAVEREVFEEAGFRVKARKVIGIYDANRTGPLEIFHAFKLVFLCDILSGEACTSDETSEVGFFAFEDLPESLSGERTRPRHLLDAFTAKSQDIQTVFD
jgi:ADP-ribose pyrophosphatase YjhB (NUDIX family)